MFSLHSSWRAKRICSFDKKAFQKSKTWLKEGSWYLNVLLLPKSVSNLASISRALFWRGAFQLAMGDESRFKDYSSLWVFTLFMAFSAFTVSP